MDVRRHRWVPGPLWRAAPLVGLRLPSWTVTLAVGVAVLVVASLSAPLLVASGFDAALTRRIAEVDPAAPEDRQPVVQAVLGGESSAELDAAVTSAIDDIPGFAPPLRSIRPVRYGSVPSAPKPTIRTADGSADAPAVLYHRDGALASLESVDGTGAAGPGLWIPDDVAAATGIHAGDAVEVVLEEPPDIVSTHPLRVAGVYRTGPDGALPVSDTLDWEALTPDLPRHPDDFSAPAPLLLADPDTVRTALAAIGETPLHTWRAQLGTAHPPAQELVTAARTIQRLDNDLASTDNALGRLVRRVVGGPELRLVSGLPEMVDDAASTAGQMRPSLASLSLAGRAVAIGVLIVATVFLTRRRDVAYRLLVAQGRHPASIGGLTVAETATAVLVGVPAGWLGAVALVRRFGPAGRLDATALDGTWTQATAMGLLAAGTIAVTAGLHAWRLGNHRTGRAEEVARSVPWPAVLAALAVAAGVRVWTSRPGDIDLLTVAFPVLVLAAASSLALRGLSRLTGRALRDPTGRGGGPVLPWLTRRRLAHALDDATAVAVLIATALGLVVYAGLLATSIRDGVEAKVAALAGAETRVPLFATWDLQAGRDDPGLPAGTSVVWRDPFVTVDDERRLDLLVVDPASFGDAAMWHHSFAPTGLADLLTALDRPAAGGAVPVLVVGPGVPTAGTLVRSDQWSQPYRVAARVNAFPGVGAGRTLVVATAGAMFGALPEHDPRVPMEQRDQRDPDGPFQAELWAAHPRVTVEALTGPVFGGPFEALMASDVRLRPDLVAQRWTLSYLAALGAAAALLGAAALILYVDRRAEQRAIAFAMLRRMGLRGRTATAVDLVESVGVVGGGLVVGGLVAGVAAWVVLPRLDPAPRLSPTLWLTVQSPVVLAGAGAAVTIAVLATVVSQARMRRADVGELLRAAD